MFFFSVIGAIQIRDDDDDNEELSYRKQMARQLHKH